jgi:hypothetical protein
VSPQGSRMTVEMQKSLRSVVPEDNLTL